jgi:hypothetical protein
VIRARRREAVGVCENVGTATARTRLDEEQRQTKKKEQARERANERRIGRSKTSEQTVCISGAFVVRRESQ